MTESTPTAGLRIAYLCLQATCEGQASYAHVFEIVAGLRKRGHTVEVFAPSYAETRRRPGPVRRVLKFVSIQARFIRALPRFDVVYVRSHPLACPASFAARRAGVPVVQECNGPYSDFYLAWPLARLLRPLLEPAARWQYGSADAVIAVTEELAEWVNTEASRDDTSVIPNGANARIFSPGATSNRDLPPKYVVFFGSLAPWQGVQMILDAVSSPSWPGDVSLVIAGDGKLTDIVVSAAAQNDRIVYLGFVPYEDMGGIVAASECSLITKQVPAGISLKMSPLKLYESMAAGVPVIVSDFADLSRQVEPAGAGLVVPQGDSTALAKAIDWLHGHPEEAREMGARGRAEVLAKHSWADRAERTARVVEAAASRVLVPVLGPSGREPHIAYVSLQAVIEGQDTWAAVTEIVNGLVEEGWRVDPYYPHYKGGIVPGLIRRAFEMARIQARLWRRIRQYDALYVRAHPAAWPIARLARRLRIPVVHECNGPYEDLFLAWPVTRFGRPIFERMQRAQYRGASAIISVAEGLTEWLKEDTGNQRVVTNGNGANVEAFTPDAPRREGLPEKFAVFFGQFPPWQGIGTLLDAVQQPDWPGDLGLVFVGDGMMRPAIEAAVTSRPDRVSYVGRLPYHQVAQVVAHAELSYVPMVAVEREAKFSPLKLYESMACGVPVVASDTIGISEVVSEWECGILAPPGDVAAVVRATSYLVEHPEEAAAMGRRGREAAVEHYSWRARARQRKEVIADAIVRSRGPVSSGDDPHI